MEDNLLLNTSDNDEELLICTQRMEEHLDLFSDLSDADADSEIIEATQEAAFCIEHGLESVLEDTSFDSVSGNFNLITGLNIHTNQLNLPIA